MAGTKEIKQRIKSVKNTKKITKAMELVAASKMKRAIFKALSSRLYANYSWDLLTSLSERLDEVNSPFFVEQKVNEDSKTLFVLITSNGGLCGAYNSQIIKKTVLALKDSAQVGPVQIDIITVGKKGDNAMRRIGQNVTASFLEIPDNSALSDLIPMSKMIIDEYKSGKYNKVYIAYTDFVSALTQKPHVKQILPIVKEDLKELIDELGDSPKAGPLGTPKSPVFGENSINKVPYIFEGDMNTIVESLAEKLVRMQIYHMILESSASEQSSRMMAMKNASEAAGEMIDDLTLVFNKARQAGITREISEISAGMASIN
ncbi:MAG: ATP synthase gamma chain [Candidatus Nomurabacteria bacterium GW2011_GWF2_35_66]|uniref:ATP synthase gamma chain n=1 Tax=Candidatus Nomurabacteria bacterium GW2011_GWE1_35_16 TaxID=1618761 RepID=A0A0G0EEN3_9BACT|nr:MAG: ATP synthase gamma chain [Candidatus Nomurabacteria bacterium GW2011_GWF1_34_20]KKP63408.1 MAG: ATP synthase gamma chain [Candidatus Nomurabacteria bacterium GW2011_GWE2_34_25]KKP65787.1 MAG: ATP synthase gamma chain [Candidatus Nomurabacteria bacterium GW2011_GWE1_35_16]KKP83646.1 MAG: ATP synthase gamma chain [Candidatus Nomurabacteria bacterium GW2011_GWF2_35_66]HAE36905.1 ATP synthase F1 subunit gamma [Candidatus Nomurabacteria bacterium]